jgi:23S rRNA (uracil1939-C5)-methyltransferase
MIQLDVERLTNGPDAMARAPDGRVVFLDAGLPGERVEAEMVAQRRDYGRARVVRLLDPPGSSPDRRAPPCPVVGECGGCPWQHLHYEAQLRLKQEVVLRELRRHARTEPAAVLPVLRGPEWRTRNRVRLAVARRRGGTALHVGFRGRASHEVVAIEDCAIAHASLAAALPLAHALARIEPALVEVELLVDDRNEIRIRAFVEPRAFPGCDADAPRGPASAGERGAERLLEALQLEARGHDLRGARLVGLSVEPLHEGTDEASAPHLAGDVEQSIELQPGIVVRVPLGVFTQVNLALNRELVAEVIRSVGPSETVVDLYAGCGNFSIPLAVGGASVLGIEANGSAVRAAVAAARRYGVESRCRFEARSVDAALRAGLLAKDFAAVVLDPPRSGAPGAVATLSPSRAARVVYVSCDVATLARDTGTLVKAGYRLDSIRLIDLTPQTYRAEVVGVFS